MKRALYLAFALLVIGFPLLAQEADDVIGSWLTEPSEHGRAHIQIYQEDGKYDGKIVWLEQPVYEAGDPMAGQPKLDRENPDPALRDRPVLGLHILQGFTYAGDDLWKGGTIYDPESGKTYKCKMWLTDDETLKVRGFIGFSLLGRNEEWTRVEADEPGEPSE
jgi:uncharacterized protein (DUF2147 family)